MFSHLLVTLIFTFVQVLIFFACLCVPAGEKFSYSTEEKWPEYRNFGQISAVAVDTSDNVYVFHRGDRQWDYQTFSQYNIFMNKNKGPITMETIVILSPTTGSLISKTGSNLFYMPHGLTVDHENNIWVTDVALHQVFKFSPLKQLNAEKSINLGEPLLSLGNAFEPGSGDYDFCKPTDVAVDRKNNDFFVSDGYCNSRIIKYNVKGQKLFHIGRTVQGIPGSNLYMLQIPHAVALDDVWDVLYVADRENFRVVSYDSMLGKAKQEFSKDLKSRIFSVAYSNKTALNNHSGLLFVLTNSTQFPKTVSIYDTQNGLFLQHLLPPDNFTNPHDLTISNSGQFCYVVELNPSKIWKFHLGIPGVNSNEPGVVNYNQKKISEVITVSKDISKTVVFDDGNTVLAVSLVSFVIIISFILFLYHYTKRKGHRKYELRRLILDEDDDGIRLT